MPNHILYITHELVSTVRIQVLHFSHQFDIKYVIKQKYGRGKPELFISKNLVLSRNTAENMSFSLLQQTQCPNTVNKSRGKTPQLETNVSLRKKKQ